MDIPTTAIDIKKLKQGAFAALREAEELMAEYYDHCTDATECFRAATICEAIKKARLTTRPAKIDLNARSKDQEFIAAIGFMKNDR